MSLETPELASLSELMSEREVYEKYGHIFVDAELRQARQGGHLEFFDLRKGVFYTEAQLLSYLEKRRRNPCLNKPLFAQENSPQPASGSSKTNGSAKSPVRLISTDTSTAETDALVAKALERTT